MASAARARVLDARVVGDAATRARWNREGTVFARRFVRVERALGLDYRRGARDATLSRTLSVVEA